ncbi:MAG: pyridoxal-phosphate dependent enzyme [Proteobacteria bacterium]|nr:pyridoxal-phosphate dependent enzyme [Pseudomonadota bacterium]
MRPTLVDLDDLEPPLDREAILAAYDRVSPYVAPTPLVHSLYLSEMYKSPIYLKLENLNIAGSFKIRGACHRLLQVSGSDLQKRGVVTTSAGNHGQGVGYMSQKLGIPATVFMPLRAPLIKISATRSYGASVILAGENYDEAQAEAHRWNQDHGAEYVHAFDHPDVVLGQGGVGLEILRKLPDVAAVIVPVGGGGLAAGVGCAVKSHVSGCLVIGVQSHRCCAAVQAYKSLMLTQKTQQKTQQKAQQKTQLRCSLGSPCQENQERDVSLHQTLADGIAVKSPSTLTLSLIKQYVDDMYCVTEEAIAGAMIELLERDRLLVEGAGAVSVAALASLFDLRKDLRGKPVVCVLSGGNVDASVLSRVIQRGLRYAHRLTRFSLILPDTPGALAGCLKAIAESGANLYAIDHNRLYTQHGMKDVEVLIELEVVDKAHKERVLHLLEAYKPQSAE